MFDRLESGGVRLFVLLVLCGVLAACGSSADSDEEYADRMSAEHRDDRPIAAAAAGAEPELQVEGAEVDYATVDGNTVTGYLARPTGNAEGLPGIIVIQEWWGLNDNIRTMARNLAAQGYVALAVDLYEGEVATDSQGARELMSAAMGREGQLDENLRQAYAYLAKKLEAPRVGVIGWCFGGGWSLRTALLLPGEIDATVIYYGRLVTDRERLATLEMPILGIFGAEDGGIPVETVEQFESILAELEKDARIHVYEGAEHAFANPSGTRYEPKAAEDAWAKTVEFFRESLQP